MWFELWTWLKRLVSPRRGNEIVVVVSPDERELLEFWTTKVEVSLPAFMKKAALDAIPASERQKFSVREQLGEMMDASFRMLDDGEGLEGRLLPLPTRAAPPKPDPIPDQLPKNHTCGFLKESYGASYGARECFGECNHPDQKGRACFWPGTVAYNCPCFRVARLRKSA